MCSATTRLHCAQVSLVFANQSEDDIILKDELDKMEKEHENFKVAQFAVSRCADRREGLTTTVSARVLPGPR
jgi:ferredoxin-NADP reductase